MPSKKIQRLDDVKRIVREMDPNITETDPSYRVAVLLLSLLAVRPWTVARLVGFTGYDRVFVSQVLARLRTNRVIDRSRLAVEWNDPESGGIAFWMDVLVGEGLMARATSAEREAAP